MKIAIVGGGITGLAAADHAEDLFPQASITIFEAKDRLGGRIETLRTSDLLIERGPDSLNAHRASTRLLLDHLNLNSEVITPLSKHCTLISDKVIEVPLSAFSSFPKSISSIFSLPHISMKGKIKWLLKQLRPSCIDESSLLNYLSSKHGEEVACKLFAPLYAGVYGGDIKQLSCKIISSPKIPSAWDCSFIGLNSGLETLIIKLKERLKNTKIVHQKIEKIEKSDRWILTGGKSKEFYDAVIVAIPSRNAAKILSSEPFAANLAEMPTHTSTIISFVTDSTTSYNLGSGSIFTDRKDGFSGVTVSSAKWIGRAPKNRTLLRVFCCAEEEENLIIAKALRKLEDLKFTNCKLIDFSQSLNDVPLYSEKTYALISKLREHEGSIRFAGASFDGVGIPDSFASGRNAVEKLKIYFNEEKLKNDTSNSTSYDRRLVSSTSVY